MMGALLVIIGLIRWTRSSLVFVGVGVLTLVLTDGRAPEGSVVVALAVLLLFSKSPGVSRIPRILRYVAAVLLLVCSSAFTLGGAAGLTGRQVIWSDFITLWRSSPWLGIGTTGITAHLNVTNGFTHAHNMFLDELVRNGVFVALAVLCVLGIGMVLPVRAALQGFAGPLALLSAYLVLCFTEVRNDWMQPSILVLLVLTCVTMCWSWLACHADEAESQ